MQRSPGVLYVLICGHSGGIFSSENLSTIRLWFYIIRWGDEGRGSGGRIPSYAASTQKLLIRANARNTPTRSAAGITACFLLIRDAHSLIDSLHIILECGAETMYDMYMLWKMLHFSLLRNSVWSIRFSPQQKLGPPLIWETFRNIVYIVEIIREKVFGFSHSIIIILSERKKGMGKIEMKVGRNYSGEAVASEFLFENQIFPMRNNICVCSYNKMPCCWF